MKKVIILSLLILIFSLTGCMTNVEKNNNTTAEDIEEILNEAGVSNDTELVSSNEQKVISKIFFMEYIVYEMFVENETNTKELEKVYDYQPKLKLEDGGKLFDNKSISKIIKSYEEGVLSKNDLIKLRKNTNFSLNINKTNEYNLEYGNNNSNKTKVDIKGFLREVNNLTK